MRDEGHIQTNHILSEVEDRVEKVYRQAAEETQKKFDDYVARFRAKDSIKRRMLLEGTITKQEYQQWQIGQVAIGKRWEEMRTVLAIDYHRSNVIARSIVRGYMPEVYALNHNYGTFLVEKGSKINTSYTLFDRQTVERLIREEPQLLPDPGEQMKKTFSKFDAYKRGITVDLTDKERKAFDKLIAHNKDIRWQEGQIQSAVTQAILQGESIPHLSQRIANTMGEINRKSTTRYARTAITAAQNAGRVDSYKRAEAMGIDLEQEWLATLDSRTRDAHRHLDGKHVKVGDPFVVDGYEIRFPGDPAAPGYLIWNCRCTLVPRVNGVDQSDALRNSRLGDMTYEEWKTEHDDNGASTMSVGDEHWEGYKTKLYDQMHTDYDTYPYKVTSTVDIEGLSAEQCDKLTPEQIKGLKSYKGSAYYDMNEYLRGQRSHISSEIQEDLQNVLSSLREAKLPQSLYGIRNTSTSSLRELLDSVEGASGDITRIVGRTFHDNGILSASVNSDYSGGGSVRFYINFPEGSKSLLLDAISPEEVRDEYEILSSPEQTYRILHAEKDEFGRIFVWMVANV